MTKVPAGVVTLCFLQASYFLLDFFTEPCPSPKFQSLLADLLTSESELATKFIDTLLNQLNWSFSEFIGMLQEVGAI